MRYSAQPKFRKYAKGYAFLLFARKFGKKYGKILMDTATKTEMDAAKAASKRVVKSNNDKATIFFIIEKLEKTTFEFS